MSMLTVTGTGKTYSHRNRQVQAVIDASLSVSVNEAVAIRGPSGCGKSTLLLMSGGLLRPTTGTVRVDGVDPYSLSPDERSAFRAQKIGFVFQQFHLIPYLNVRQNILTANLANRQPEPEHRVGELVEQFGLEHRVHHVPAELSVGERQRVALARALFCRPKLVLADEPTGNLDADNAATVLDALWEFANDGGAVLLVTHDPQAAQRSHRTVEMDQGRLETVAASM
jgi:ABC-type lipoprotein export system ATPase subunit